MMVDSHKTYAVICGCDVILTITICMYNLFSAGRGGAPRNGSLP